ncbi:hypothetical protein LOZ53_004262 [Ophidiomyces ophidiicola]|nr:hypothetical protein LOZ55_005167 [Ophidiomyces ophidiicola]KAI1981483.1 hypothetical protein LOZ54_005585 [Ophidiomyces ophidiicola]KAI1987571.1 hypothetical protein LOZ53_004262 [Ophidiomyces ophidiicola]
MATAGKKKTKNKKKKKKKKISRQCSALTHSFDACKNRAATVPALLPVCWAHRKLGRTVTFCQAVLARNRKCLKKIPWCERRQVCAKHADFPLPCHILRLPTELRQQIFSYILDDYKSQYAEFYTYFSFLKMAQLNHQIFEEACDVLYRNFECKIYFYREELYILGRKCLLVQPGSWQYFKQYCFTLERRENHEQAFNNIKLIATHLNGPDIKLHILVRAYAHDIRCIRDVYKALPSFLDAFRQLGSVREARLTIDPDPSTRLREIEQRGGLSEETTAIVLGWIQYYKQWTDDMERGHSA